MPLYTSLSFWILFFFVPVAYTTHFVDNFVVIKWLGVYLWALMATIYSLKSKAIDQHSLPSGFVLFVGGLLLIRGILLVFFRDFSVEWFSFFDGLVFAWIATLSFSWARQAGLKSSESGSFQAILELVKKPFLLGLAFVLLRALVQFITARFIEGQFSTFEFVSSFGNINMLSEYLLIGLPLLLLLSKSHQARETRWVAHVLLGLSVFFIYWSQSRSSLLGLGMVAGGAALFKMLEKSHLKMMGLVVGVSLGLHLLWSDGQLNKIDSEKSASNTARWSLIESSLELMATKPWGIGSELFEFYIAPYRVTTEDPQNERVLDRTPHNELLRWGIEYGWLYLLLSLWGLAAVFWRAWKMPNKIYVLTFLAYLPQILFQFPFLNAFSFAYAAWMLGCLMAEQKPQESSTLMRAEWFTAIMRFRFFSALKLRWLAILYIILAVPSFSLTTWSKYEEVHAAMDQERSQRACRIYPVNWRSCLNVVQYYFNHGDSQKSIKASFEELERHPFNLTALKFVVLNELKLGHHEQACDTANLYEELLSHRGQFTRFVQMTCKGPSRFKGLTKLAFEEAYWRWFNERSAVYRHSP